MNEDEPTPPVVCTLNEREEAERPEAVQRTLTSLYLGSEERPHGYTYRFEGTDDALLAAATFTANELQCCSFATYSIEVSSPYEETRLTITGPEGTKELFTELVDRLETAAG